MFYSLSAKAMVASCLLSLAVLPAGAALGNFELCSPKNGDHFEVTQPMFFWQSSVGAARYEVVVDGTPVGKVDAAPVPVMSCAPEKALAVGQHQWCVRAFSASDEAVVSTNLTFTVDPSGNWPAWAIGPFARYGKNPILQPLSTSWENWNIYNPGVIYEAGRFRMYYRGQETNKTSRVGYAESLDGVTFLCSPVPIIDAMQGFEKTYGCEDPRIVSYQGTYYIFYTGNRNEHSRQICLCEATSKDGIHWKKLGVIEAGTKNGAIVRDPAGTPIKINGKFVMYTGDSKFGVCFSEDLTTWSPITWIDLHFPAGWRTPYEPCVAIADHCASRPDDIVVFIAGTLNGKGKWYYAISEVLFAKSDLTKKAAQLDDCIMQPRESYESGTFQNCLWMNSLIQYQGQWWMHYGAGDRNVGLATAPCKL